MKILIIDNNLDQDSWGSGNIRNHVAQTPGVTIFTRRAPHNDLPKNIEAFDKLILSGSRMSCLEETDWTLSLDRFVSQAIKREIPTLGICYGHQCINRVLSSQDHLGQAPHPEFGWIQITQTEENPLFKGLPKSFYSYSSHQEQVHTLAPGMKRIAFSEDCEFQACQYKNLPIWGIQFHPEQSLERGTFYLRKRLQEKKKGGLHHPLDSKKYFNAQVGRIIFSNFLNT